MIFCTLPYFYRRSGDGIFLLPLMLIIFSCKSIFGAVQTGENLIIVSEGFESEGKLCVLINAKPRKEPLIIL